MVRGPARSGKSAVLRDLALALRLGHPELDLSYVLVAGRPEEATELETDAPFPVLCTTFDEPDTRHTQVVDIATERARRLAEHQRDTVLIVDGINALVRASNAVGPATGRSFTEGVDLAALARARRLLGTARAIPGGGSVTVITSLQTGTPADDAIGRELSGHENWLLPLTLDGRFPSVDLAQVHTVDRFLAGDERERRARWRSRVGTDLEAAQHLDLDNVPPPGEQAASFPGRS